MFGYITKGEIELYYDGEIHRLKEGDSFYFDSRKKHWYRCENAQAELITVAFRYRRF